MKYYRLHIDSKNNFETYSKITEILGVNPAEYIVTEKDENLYSLWTYTFDENEDELETPSYDFINTFLDILESKFVELKKIGIKKKHITFWLNHEYNQQCAMEFTPKEMKRLGKSGITLCIDCWQKVGTSAL